MTTNFVDNYFADICSALDEELETNEAIFANIDENYIGIKRGCEAFIAE